MRKFFYIFFVAIVLGCGGNSNMAMMEEVDSLIARNLDDSANAVFNMIDTNSVGNGDARAYYNLLKTELVFRSGAVLNSDSMIDASIAHYERSGDIHKLAQAYYFKGRMQHERGETVEAIMTLKKAEFTAKDIGDDWLKARIFVNLACFNGTKGEFRLALEYCKKAVNPALNCGNKITILDVYSEMSVIYGNLGLVDSSIVCMEKCEPYIDFVKEKGYKAHVYSALASLYNKKGNIAKAKGYALASLQLSSKYDTYYILSDIYRQEGDIAKADSLRDLAYGKADARYRLMILTDMWEEAKSAGNFEEATVLSERITALRDSLAERERIDGIRERQATFGAEATVGEVVDASAGRVKAVVSVAAVLVLAVLALAVGKVRKGKRDLAKERSNAAERMAKAMEETSKHKDRADRMEKVIRGLRHDVQQGSAKVGKQEAQLEALKEELSHSRERADECLREFSQMLVDVLLRNKSIGTWGSKKQARFVTWCEVAIDGVGEMLSGYSQKLTDHNKLLAILLYMGKSDGDICNIMGLSMASCHKAIARLKNKQ